MSQSITLLLSPQLPLFTWKFEVCAIETIAKWHSFGELHSLFGIIPPSFYNSSIYGMKTTVNFIKQQFNIKKQTKKS